METFLVFCPLPMITGAPGALEFGLQNTKVPVLAGLQAMERNPAGAVPVYQGAAS
jgi:hypothetical protein